MIDRKIKARALRSELKPLLNEIFRSPNLILAFLRFYRKERSCSERGKVRAIQGERPVFLRAKLSENFCYLVKAHFPQSCSPVSFGYWEGFPRPNLTYSLLVFQVNVSTEACTTKRVPQKLLPTTIIPSQFLHSPVEDASLFQDVSQVNVGVQEIRVQRHSFLKVMNG